MNSAKSARPKYSPSRVRWNWLCRRGCWDRLRRRAEGARYRSRRFRPSCGGPCGCSPTSSRLALTSTPCAMQPPDGVKVPLADRKMQGDGITPVWANARRIIVQHRLGLAIAAEIDRRQEIEPCAGRQKSGLNRRIGLLLRGRRQRRRTGRIGCIRVGAELEQQLHDCEPVSRSRVVQGRAAMMTAGHPRGEQRRVAGDHRPHIVDFIERDRTPQIERRPMTRAGTRPRPLAPAGSRSPSQGCRPRGRPLCPRRRHPPPPAA